MTSIKLVTSVNLLRKNMIIYLQQVELDRHNDDITAFAISKAFKKI
jgi:hypothetical protein